jgi:hypothetical protein
MVGFLSAAADPTKTPGQTFEKRTGTAQKMSSQNPQNSNNNASLK